MKSIVKIIAGTLVLGLMVAPAAADVTINEVLASTTGSDSEFIELYNSGPGSVDIGLWSIELWESDITSTIPGTDGGSPYVIPFGTILAEDGFYLMANTVYQGFYTNVADQTIQDNAIENSSHTMILKDAALSTIFTVFSTDGGAGDFANDNGVAVTPDVTYGPDGTFTQAGYFLFPDGGSGVGALEFSPQPAPSATPGKTNIPEPMTLAFMALGGLAAVRRRR